MMQYISENYNNPESRKDWGSDSESVEISKALFDLSS